MAARGPILALDTATSVALVAIGGASGQLRRESAWSAGFRHGEELLGRVVELLAAEGLWRDDLGAVVVGTGPGAFTGLRIGLATAKTLAHELEVPIVGISTAAALAHAARWGGGVTGPLAVLLPAGPSGIVVVEFEAAAGDGGGRWPGGRPARLVTGGARLELGAGVTAIAVDLDGRATGPALELGRDARRGLATSLVTLGAARIAAGEHDDVARLVPEYVSLPRGVKAVSGEVAWSLDRR